MGIFYIFAQKITKDMEQRLIGREAELKLLNEYINSDRSEFIAVYGRRRVGKTFLIRKAVEDHFAFFMTGMNGVAKGEQLVNFSISLQNIPTPPLCRRSRAGCWHSMPCHNT